MAGSKDYAVLDLQNETDSLGVDLQFQDFGDARTTQSAVSEDGRHEQTMVFDDFPDTADDELEHDKLLGEEDDVKPIGLKQGVGFWSFEFYQQFFNVESKQVGDRIVWSMVPKPGISYLQSYIRPNPDLYGPFWICMTLTFTTAITGNLANYLGTDPDDTYIWRYDFHKVTLAATAIFAYATLVPLAMWGVLIWRGARARISLLEILCIYGYSLAIFVPVSILWIVPFAWFKWCLAIVAPVLSGSVLVRTIWPSLSHDAKQVAIGVAVFILLLHATLALGFMLYFFAAPDRVTSAPITPIKSDIPENAAVKESDQAPQQKESEKEPKDDNESPDENKKEDVKDGGGGKKEDSKRDSESGADDANIEEKEVKKPESASLIKEEAAPAPQENAAEEKKNENENSEAKQAEKSNNDDVQKTGDIKSDESAIEGERQKRNIAS